MEAVEGAATIPENGGGPTETQWPKPALPGARAKPETTRAVVNEAARVIPQEHFFRAHVRPSGVLRAIFTPAAKPVTALLLRVVPASAERAQERKRRWKQVRI